MAHKPTSYKLVEKKKKNGEVNKYIVIYTNINVPAEKSAIEYYMNNGYEAMFEEKKPSLTVAEMKNKLKGDKEALETFENKYKESFFDACQFYNSWKKEHDKKEDKKQEDKQEKKQEDKKDK